MTLPNGIRVPNWAVGAISAAATLIGLGFLLGAKAQADSQRDQVVNYRLCRIEHALGIEPWQTCPDPQQLRGGGPVR